MPRWCHGLPLEPVSPVWASKTRRTHGQGGSSPSEKCQGFGAFLSFLTRVANEIGPLAGDAKKIIGRARLKHSSFSGVVALRCSSVRCSYLRKTVEYRQTVRDFFACSGEGDL
jgi:hypothetical protein